ncbi:nitrogen fixation negative regulator NifL [Celerinatantimonas sp. YJH-8]|uniref:nitrogen fixation negative regulator NifL n=1 Tax=Celerinatantimonas sp. YJH-8 TaxID=3228714 RepID=UPI0038C32E15
MAEAFHPLQNISELPSHFSELLQTLPAELFLQVVEQAPVAISITDLKANICYANQRFSALTGYSLDELKGQNQRMLSSHQTPKSCYETLWQTIISGQSWRGRLVNQTRQGQEYLAEVTIAPVFSKDGEMSHFIGIQRDISEPYRLTQELTNQKAHFEAVLNASDHVTVVFDEQYNVILDNLAYKTLYTDLRGPEPLEFFRHQLQAQHQLELATLLTNGESVEIEYWIRGEKRWLSLSCQPLIHVNETVSHYFSESNEGLFILIGQDCTAERQLLVQHHLESLQGQLADSKMLAAIRETLQTAIYQVSQPINLLYAAARLESPLTGPSQALNEVLTSAEQALQALKANTPQLKPETGQSIAIETLTEDFILLATSRAKRLLVHLVIDESVSGKLYGQRIRLLSALDLVLEHALIAAINGGRGDDEHYPQVQIRFDKGELNTWRVYIQDNGPILEQSASHRIMQPFYNRESLRDEFGLGLCLARDILLDHQGAMDIEPIQGGGSCVILSIPMDKKEGNYAD